MISYKLVSHCKVLGPIISELRALLWGHSTGGRPDSVYIRSAAKVGGSATKIHKKGREIFGSASTPRQDVIHLGLSVSRGRPAVGSGCFVQTGLETTRTNPKALADKPYQAMTNPINRQTGLEKDTDSPQPDLQSVLPLQF